MTPGIADTSARDTPFPTYLCVAFALIAVFVVGVVFTGRSVGKQADNRTNNENKDKDKTSSKNANKTTTAAVAIADNTFGPLESKIPANSNAPHSRMQSSSIGRTPPVTPPAACGSPGSPMSAGSPHVKGVAAPASAVDDVMEKFGRPRSARLSRRRDSDKANSLPAWEEEGDEGNLMPFLEDRRRAVSICADGQYDFNSDFSDEDRGRSMSLASAEESWRGGPSGDARRIREAEDAWRQRDTEEVKLHKQCKRPGCHKPPVMGEDGQTAYLCRDHKRPGMVNVTGDRCERRGCNLAPTYGFPEKGRQRCFSHKEPGMVHVLGTGASAADVSKIGLDDETNKEELAPAAPAHTTPAAVEPSGVEA